MAVATTTEHCYDQLVVVAEQECKLDYTFVSVGQDSRGDGKIVSTLKVGQIEWEVSFYHCQPERDYEDPLTMHWHYDGQKQWLRFQSKDVREGRLDQAHLEVLLYRWDKQKAGYAMVESPKRLKFTLKDETMSFHFADEKLFEKKMLLFHLRVLQDRASLPDFTLATTTLGHLTADVQLRVGEQTFHINKQLLSTHSEYFDRMFTGGYKEANQAVVELKHEEANDPALFHDFLLVMCVPEVLPNSKNVADLLKLARIYPTEGVTRKCLNHLRMCREMPVEQRVLLAGEYGNEKLQAFIENNLNLEEAKLAISALRKKAFAPYSQQQQQNKQG